MATIHAHADHARCICPTIKAMTGSNADWAAWNAACDQLDPAPKLRDITRADQAALKTPTTLAAHLWRHYQVRAHLTIVGEQIRAIHDGEGDRLLLTMPPQCGKPVYAGTMVLMGDGSRKRIDDIEVGDTVITHTGQARRVSAVHRQGLLECVTITTFGGRRTTAALDHPFLTPAGWVPAGKLQVGMTLATVMSAETNPKTNLTPEEARLLGYFIGDGSVSHNQAMITSASPAVVTEMTRCAKSLNFKIHRSESKKPNRASFFAFSNGVRPWLRHHGLSGSTSHSKRVPQAIFTSPKHVIAEFIGGYWDCDGGVSMKGDDRHGNPRPDLLLELYSSSRELMQDVQHLLLRLGISSTVRSKNSIYLGKPYLSWRLQILSRDSVRRFQDQIRVCQELKAGRLHSYGFPRNRFFSRLEGDEITAIEQVGLKECLCLTVDIDHTFTADDLVVHNTVTAVVWSAFWWLCLNPTAQLMLISYNDQLAVQRGHAVRKLVEEFGARYGLYLDPSSRAKHEWMLTTGGGMRSLGIGSGITGNPADVIWIDDPHKNREEAESSAVRQKVHDSWSSDIISRLAPFTPVIVVQTRWHEDDLAGRRVREEGRAGQGGRWRVVNMPAFCTDPYTDPLGRMFGEPLPHPKIREGDTQACARHWNDKKAGATVRDWFALWQGDPRPTEGALLSWDVLRERRCYEHGKTGCAQPKRIGVAIDPSGGGRDTAGIIGGYLGEDGRLAFTHDRSGVMSSDLWGRKACELAAEIDADCFVIETDYGGDQALLVLRTSWEALRRENPERYSVFCPRVIAVKARGRGKLLRAEPIAQQWKEDRCRTAQYLPDLEAEWATWQPDSKNSPGRIDASVYLAYEMLPIPPSGQASVADPARAQIDLTRNLTPGEIGLIR